MLGPGSFAFAKALPLLDLLGCCLKLLVLSKHGGRSRLGRFNYCDGFRPRPKQPFCSLWINPEGCRWSSYSCQQYLCQFVRAETRQNCLRQGCDDFCSTVPVAADIKSYKKKKKILKNQKPNEPTNNADETPEALQFQLPQQRLQVCIF